VLSMRAPGPASRTQRSHCLRLARLMRVRCGLTDGGLDLPSSVAISTRRWGEVKVLKFLVAATVCAALIATTAGPAAADPTQAPGSASLTFTCGGVPVTLTVLPNGSAAAFTSSTSVGIAVGNGSEVTPGFEHNGIQTTQCTITLGGRTITVTAFFTPPHH
jgi:hypothetical protein